MGEGFVLHSVLVLILLLALLAMSVGMFWLLLWRETSNRYEQALLEWARTAGYRRRRTDDGLIPEPLPLLGGVRVVRWFTSRRCQVLQFTLPPTTSDTSAPPIGPYRRHVLIRAIETHWPPVALRPTHEGRSLIDLLNLPPQKTDTSRQRFSIHANESKVAARVANSSLAGLLPPDIGLLLVGSHVVLEFSDRPFDGIEFNRMRAVVEQIVSHLPGAA